MKFALLLALTLTLVSVPPALATEEHPAPASDSFMKRDNSIPQWTAPPVEEPSSDSEAPAPAPEPEAVDETRPPEEQPAPAKLSVESPGAPSTESKAATEGPLDTLFETATEAAKPKHPPAATPPSKATETVHGTGLAGWLGVPHLHPLVVHFPIVLLILGPLFMLAGWVFYSEGTQDAGVIIGVFGFLTALLASQVVHPHVADLPAAARDALNWHERFADLTLLTAGVASLFGGLRWLIRPLRRAFSVLALVTFLASAVCVTLTGHFGATVVHVHGVGPQGAYLEIGH